MIWVFLFMFSIVGMVVLYTSRKRIPVPAAFVGAELFLLLVALASIWNTSVVMPGGHQIAVFDRKYICSSIEDGRNVALSGECGRQAEIMMPGFHLSPFVGVLNGITYVDMVDVPDGHYAVLTARDGMKLDEGQVAAKPWLLGTNEFVNDDGETVKGNMLDATFFLTEGMGRKGPQATVLTPGRYPINTFLWIVDVDRAIPAEDGDTATNKYVRTTIAPGHVGVVKSAIDENIIPAFVHNSGDAVDCSGGSSEEKDLGQIKAVLAPVGCRGVWKEPLPPGDYFINRLVYEVTPVDTRIQNWTYKGGYTSRVIDMRVEENGTISQKERIDKIPLEEDAAGEAIAVKVEGWTVLQELRLQARVTPEYAPLVVAAVGGLEEIEDRIITPQVRSVLRNVGGSRITVKNTAAYDEAKSELDALKARLEVLRDPNTDIGLSKEQRAQEASQLEKRVVSIKLPDPNKEVERPTLVLDFQNERAALEKLVAGDIQKIGSEAGIEIVSVTFGNADIPPELLVARKTEQLSGQLRNAYTQMRTAQVQRQATEAAKARADKQSELVAARIKVETSQLGIEQRTNDGLAEQKYLEALAEGQQAQVNVLGPDRVLTFNIISELMKHPEVVGALKLPSTLTISQGGQGGGLDTLASILGATKFFGGPAAAQLEQ